MTDDDFDRITMRQQNRKIIRSSTWVSLIGAGLFLLSGYFIYKLTPPPYTQLNESHISQSEATLSVTMVQKDANDHWKRLDHTPDSGEQIAFQVSTTQPVHATLFKVSTPGWPRTLFNDIRIPPGENRIINFENADYRYTVKNHDKAVRFCLVIAINSKELTKKLLAMQGKRPLDELPDEHCVNLTQRE